MENLDLLEQTFRVISMMAHKAGEADSRGRPPLPPAQEIRSGHRFDSLQQLQVEASGNANLVLYSGRSYVSNPIYPSRNPFSSLKRTSIAKLYLQVSAVGKYIIIRVLERGLLHIIAGWSTVVEDDQGNVCAFCVYNYPPQELFPVGTVLILKEPYFKMSPRGAQIIRCDCPTDIIVLRPSHPLYYVSQGVKWKNELCEPVEDPLFRPPVPVAASQWKERGNALYNRKQLILAREAYQLGLQVCQQADPTFKLLQLNLTAVNLELGNFDKVIEIARDILQQSPTEKKALFRAGRAHYELRQYEEALNHFKKLQQFHPNDGEGRNELDRAQHRVQEMETGRVSIKRLRKMMAKAPSKEIDCADYVGPVKVIDIPGKGRGVVLTEDVEPQTILMISKALVATINPHFLTDRLLLEIVTKLAQLVTKNPTTIGPLVYDLSTGVEPREKIKQYCDPGTKEEPICDVEKLYPICNCNTFAIGDVEGGQYKEVGAGLFLLPSYMNHSCVPNVTKTYYNDVMIVRAAQRLKVGDELFVNYVPIPCSYKKRAEGLSKYGFSCQCPLCVIKK